MFGDPRYDQLRQYLMQKAMQDNGINMQAPDVEPQMDAGMSMRTPGYSSSPGAEDSLNRQYGPAYQQPTSPFGALINPHPNPFMIFNNQRGFGHDHPRIAGGLEGAMRVLANMGEPSLSAGGNMSNVARGMIGASEMQRQHIDRERYEPMEMMGRMLPFYKARQDAAVNQAHIDYYSAMAGKARAYDPKQFGQQVYSDEQGDYILDLTDGQKKYIGKGAAKVGGAGSQGKLPPWVKTEAERPAYLELVQEGWDFGPDPARPKLPKDWSRRVKRHSDDFAAGRGAAGAAGRIRSDQNAGGTSDVENKEIDASKTEWELREREAQDDRSKVRKQLPAGSGQDAVTAEMNARKSRAAEAKKRYDDLRGGITERHSGGGSRPKPHAGAAPTTAEEYLKH